MFNWLKNLFRKEERPKKEVGGFEIFDGVVLGAGYFSKDGKQSSALICPPIWAFNYGITNTLNRLNQVDLPSEEFQSTFNSILDDLIAETLVYLENRLKLIAVNDKLKYRMNSISESVKAYSNLANIKLEDKTDVPFLKALDRVRGYKHHTHRRYDANFSINDVEYGSVESLRSLVGQVRKKIKALDGELARAHKDYEIKTERMPKAIKVEWTAVNHALDMTQGGKIVAQKQTTGLDPTQVKFFAVQVNYK
ncbi:MAG: hypothetical protein HYV42_00425 [Candidatus Magasanikbacteria bacterium]|nr:hypothetical protein [Candidatus Magasanikbacteria bacterium]